MVKTNDYCGELHQQPASNVNNAGDRKPVGLILIYATRTSVTTSRQTTRLIVITRLSIHHSADAAAASDRS